MLAKTTTKTRRKHCHCRDRVHYAVSDTTPEHPSKKRGYCSEGLSVVNSCRETPGPIPNPEAKPAHADGTATGRLWESKSPPTPNKKHNSISQEREEDGTLTVLFPSFTFCGSRRCATTLRHTRSLPLDVVMLHVLAWGSSRQRTLNLCFYPRCWLWCDSGDPCRFRVSYSNINTPTRGTCPPVGIL